MAVALSLPAPSQGEDGGGSAWSYGLLDCALGGAGCWLGNDDDIRPAVTLNLSINFVSAPKGERLIAEGRRIGGGKKVYYSEGALRDETGHLLCSATGVFRYVG